MASDNGHKFQPFIWSIYMCCKGLWHLLSADRGVSIITFIAQYAQVIKNNSKDYLTSVCRNLTETRGGKGGEKEEKREVWRKRSERREERAPTFSSEGKQELRLVWLLVWEWKVKSEINIMNQIKSYVTSRSACWPHHSFPIVGCSSPLHKLMPKIF